MRCLACSFRNPQANQAYCWEHRGRMVRPISLQPWRPGRVPAETGRENASNVPMIASVLGSSASKHRFRCSEALLPMAGCRHTQHCFQKAMARTNRDVCFPKPCPNPMGGATNP